MDKLPTEILELILSCKSLSFTDICNMNVTCARFHRIIMKNNNIWKAQFLHRWPQLKLINEYHDEIKWVFKIREKTRRYIEVMPHNFVHFEEIGEVELEHWQELVKIRQNYAYVVDYLMELIADRSPIDGIMPVLTMIPGNLSVRYYSYKVLTILRQTKLEDEIKEYMNNSENLMLLERGAYLVSQWCQPIKTIRYESIQKKLDSLAEEVKRSLKLRNCKHPLFDVSQETFEKWRRENIFSNQYDEQSIMEIIDVINVVLYDVHGFYDNHINFYNPANSFLEQVLDLKAGIPITLSIIYESVARRLGVNVYPFNSPVQFSLKLAIQSKIITIEPYNRGIFTVEDYTNREHPIRATFSETVTRMALNIKNCEYHNSTAKLSPQLRSIMKFLVLVAPDKLIHMMQLISISVHYRLNVKWVLKVLQEEYIEEYANIMQLRMYNASVSSLQEGLKADYNQSTEYKHLKFAIGLIVENINTREKGVIYDWTAIPTRIRRTGERIKNVLPYQPHYYILLENGEKRYIPEDKLRVVADPGNLLNQIEVGRHFSHFHENHFVPTPAKEASYPYDDIRRHNFYQVMNWKLK